MSITTTQLIFIVVALIVMFVGLVILYKALRKSVREKNQLDFSDTQDTEGNLEQTSITQITDTNNADLHGKDGFPIIPRHQRPEINEIFKAEITPNNPDGSIVLSAENTELQLQETEKNQNVDFGKPAETEILPVVTPEPRMVLSPNDGISRPQTQIQPPPESDDAFSMLANATETITPVVHTFDENKLKKEAFVENSPILDTHIQTQVTQEQNSPLNNAIQNINISIFPKQELARFTGRDILTLVDKYGMKYGAMNMFHRYENKDGTGLLWFSMMMITEDGVSPFDLNKLPNQLMKGLVLFLSLPHPKAVQGFDSMMSVAGLMAHDLEASVYDDSGMPINKENTQVMREIAISFDKR